MRRLVDKVVATQKELTVTGYLSLEMEDENVKFWSGRRHYQLKNQYLEFQFSFHPPNPRKERIIVERDALGRTVHSQPPQFKF